jgi:hypothetical protein
MGKAAIAAVKEDPVAALRRLADKMQRGFASSEIARNESFADERVASAVFRLPVPPFALLFGLGVCYLVLGGRWRGAMILCLPWLVVFASETVFFNASRYRSLAIPFLLPLCVAGAVALWRALARREQRVTAGVMMIFVALLVFLGATAVPMQERASESASELLKMARLELYYVDHRLLPDLRPAHPARLEARLESALRIDPEHLSAHYLWSMWQIRRGKSGDARARNAIRQARCPEQDWLCREVCGRIAEIAAAPGRYRLQIESTVAEKKRMRDE